MPTPSKSKAVSKKTQDIRGFFGGKSNTKSELVDTHVKSKAGAVKTRPIEISDDDQESTPQLPVPSKSASRKKPSALISSDEEDVPQSSHSRKKPAPEQKLDAKASFTEPRKKALKIVDSDEDYMDEDDLPNPPKPAKASKQPTTSKSISTDKAKPKTNVTGMDGARKTGKDDTKPSFKPNWVAAKATKMANQTNGPVNVPSPADPNCLSGLTFVFTGELDSLSRDEAVDLAKRYGGRVTGQPSSRTSYVVVGADAGPSKLAAIKKNNLPTLDESGFLNLIATRTPEKLDDKARKKIEKEELAIKQAAKEMERRERSSKNHADDLSNQLWTDRYAPQTLKEVCGNKIQVERLQQWLNDWPNSVKAHFKKPGKNGMNVFRAVLISGPPGIGKTTSAHLCARLAGFTPIELNASDARSKKLVENSTNVSNTSLDGWMAGGSATNAAGITITDKTCLIMDEVDGMSAGDRGGVGALVALIKKSKVPIICIANDKGAMKLKSLVSTCFNLPFKRPEAAAIRSRILTIAFKEKMKIPAPVIDQLVAGAQSDIRQVLNMLSTWKLSSNTIDFDQSKSLSKMNEKNSIMTPFDITYKMLGPYLFSATARETLGEKMELYFHDHSFMPLFMQENYLKTQPSRVKNESGPEKILKQLELMDKAASSISDGDLVDAMIHSSEQHWSLMPLHAVCSTVRPASYMYGHGGGYGSPNPICFPVWLGQNSKQNKLTRQLTDIQARMRLKVSGDRVEIRRFYVPALYPHIVKPLIDQGGSAVDDVIITMDEYYLNREDWDTIVELGVDEYRDEIVLKKIPAVTKTALTRKYNAGDHPVAFHKAVALGKSAKKLAAVGPAPDLEDAYEVDDELEEESEDKTNGDDDVSQDSLIKVPKKTAKAKGGAVAKAKATKTAVKKKSK
ncbi:Replication factor C subunit 1 [Abortiporus biennis]